MFPIESGASFWRAQFRKRWSDDKQQRTWLKQGNVGYDSIRCCASLVSAAEKIAETTINAKRFSHLWCLMKALLQC
jgi:hypothetical protein